MSTKTVKFDRQFQVWKYQVGHGRLLLRSPKNNINKSRIDLLFKNVTYIGIPTAFETMLVEIADDMEMKGIVNKIGTSVPKDSRLYIINEAFYIVAAYFGSHEDDLEYFEDSHFDR